MLDQFDLLIFLNHNFSFSLKIITILKKEFNLQKKMNSWFQAAERKAAFQAEMEVSGRFSAEPTDETARLKSVSTENMQKELSKLKDDQSKHSFPLLYF